MGTLVCFAMKEETPAFRRRIAGRTNVSILVTGIGQANSEKSLRKFLENNSPKIVLTCGFAGGLNPQLKSGDVVYWTEDGSFGQALAATGALAVRFQCAPRIVVTVVEKTELRRTTGADAVEMESDAIQKICRERGIPCATVRVISDSAEEDLPLDFNKLSNSDMSLNYLKLFCAIAKSPGKIPALMQFGKKTRLAGERLAGVLERLL